MTVTTAQARHQAGLYRVTGTPVAASIVVSLCDQLDALTLAFETEREAANLYAKQVAHWIGKHDALLEQQLEAQAAQSAHAHAIDTSPERVEKHAGDVQVPEGWKLVPVEPTEAMWSELARDIVFWLYATRSPHYGSKLHSHLQNLGREIPSWLTKEVPDVDHTPPKGTVAVCIYKAMLAAAPSTKEQTE